MLNAVTVHGSPWDHDDVDVIREVHEHVAELGENVMFYVPTKSRAEMDPVWKFGVFLGHTLASDQNYVGLHDGSATRAKALVRTVPRIRWDRGRIQALTATPSQERPTKLDSIEAEENPHLHADSEQHQDGVDPQRAKRGLKNELRDLHKYGFTPGCP